MNRSRAGYEAVLQEHGKTYEAFTYPGTRHGFHNNSTPRYDETAANPAGETSRVRGCRVTASRGGRLR